MERGRSREERKRIGRRLQRLEEKRNTLQAALLQILLLGGEHSAAKLKERSNDIGRVESYGDGTWGG